MDTGRLARLEPSAAPGRGNRKARAFHFVILRLQHEGYGLNDIRAALADASGRVSKSTMHREVVRSRAVRPALPSKVPLPHDQVAVAPQSAANTLAGRLDDSLQSSDG